MPRHLRRAAVAAAVLFAFPAFDAGAAGVPAVAGLQVTLRHHHVYAGPVDGVAGAATTAALIRFQRSHGLPGNGVLGAATRRAFGRFAQYALGARPLSPGMTGWDVGELQFALAWHGFPSGTIDGAFGARTQRALLKFQSWAGVPATGVVTADTVAALRQPLPRCPIALAWPLQATVGDRFGPRGARFHPAIDLPAARGTAVGAAARGRVVFAGYDPAGYGKLVQVAHSGGVVTMYAHLSAVTVRPGAAVATGTVVGRVGSTGESTGPHLHFEVRVRGAAVDPVPALR